MGVAPFWTSAARIYGALIISLGLVNVSFGQVKPEQESANQPINQLTEQEVADEFKLIFDGKSFDGWNGNQAVFQIKEGSIIGGNLEKPVARNEFLRTTKIYADFELRLQFKLVGEGSNAGVQFRTEEIPNDHEVSGYQADMGDGWWGCLYDESRRNKVLTGPTNEERNALVKKDDWNDYRIRCEGDQIQLWVNGKQTVDYREPDEAIARSGIIAVQIHGGPPAQAFYRTIRIKTLHQK